MRFVVWLVVLFVVAVVAATGLGGNDGLASFYWRGWRLDLSLNFFIVLLLLTFVALGSSVRLTRWLVGLPGRARAWREGRREQALQAAQRESMIELFAARYSRAVKAAERAQSLMGDLPGRSAATETQALHHLLAAQALHQLQNRSARDEQAALAQACLGPGGAMKPSGAQTSLLEGLQLLRAGWALEDRDAAASLDHLAAMQPGAARRIQAQRLRLQAHRMAGEPAEALKAARLLAKRGVFKPEAARSLTRTLAMAVLDTARDPEGLQKVWLSLDREDRQDPTVLAHAVHRAASLQAPAWARRVLRVAWEGAAALAPEQRESLALALWKVSSGIEPEWLGPAESLAASHPREPAVVAVAAVVCAERQLWGKAQPLLEQTARSSAPLEVRRDAWCRLAQIARERGDEAAAAAAFERAASLR